ncbi:uncharacterized protein LOC123430982 [Hordeum vulgare subsp. vulgare]|uniref:uncharacterized protein LOC123430982 n=1 Tax=Hordeum vulgare subsp. vulgare TaxID=112509 RepID=UPI000B476009|nr:uncharacterized protein LOC123430982 [Hordeum vulgare subsp. vulgare]
MMTSGRSIPYLAAGASGSVGLPFGGWCVMVGRDGGSLTRSVGGGAARSAPRCGPWCLDCGRRGGGCDTSAAGRIRMDSSLVGSITVRATPRETLDLLEIERWWCFCVAAPLQDVVLEFAPVEGTNDADGARAVAQMPMKITPTMVMVDDGDVFDVARLSRHRC